jgi:hypothetical protein
MDQSCCRSGKALLAASALGSWRLVALKLPAERPVAPVAKMELVKMELVTLKSVKMPQQAM